MATRGGGLRGRAGTQTMTYRSVRDPCRLTVRASAVLLLATLVLALPATAHAADGPRFLLVATPNGAAVHLRPNGRVIANVPGSTPLGPASCLWVTATTTRPRPAPAPRTAVCAWPPPR